MKFINILQTYIVVNFIFLLLSCSTFRIPASTIKSLGDTDAYVVAFDATSRASVIHLYNDEKNGEQIRVISEVPPDAIVSSTIELLAKISSQQGAETISAEGQVKIAEAVSQLGKRTAAVNILRDALYRLQEMRGNQAITENDAKLFKIVLDSAVQIAKAELVENETRLVSERISLIKTLESQNWTSEEIKKYLLTND